MLPGRFTETWFHTTKVGTYHLFCAQYCGTEHSGMIGEVIVMEPTAYQAWLASGGGYAARWRPTDSNSFSSWAAPPAIASTRRAADPNLAGLYGKPVLLDDGRTVTADENYFANRS